MSRERMGELPVICITNRRLCEIPFLEQVEKIAAAGFPWMILREKDLEDKAYRKLAYEFLGICRKYGTIGILHSCTEEDLVREAGGIHLPMEMLRKFRQEGASWGQRAPQGAAELPWGQRAPQGVTELPWGQSAPQGATKLLGASVHSVAEAQEAQLLGADYVLAGHIYATDCKRGIPGRGLSFLREAAAAVDIPVYALGGIQPGCLPEVKASGAAGAAVMSGLMMEKDPKRLAIEMREIWAGL